MRRDAVCSGTAGIWSFGWLDSVFQQVNAGAIVLLADLLLLKVDVWKDVKQQVDRSEETCPQVSCQGVVFLPFLTGMTVVRTLSGSLG